MRFPGRPNLSASRSSSPSGSRRSAPRASIVFRRASIFLAALLLPAAAKAGPAIEIDPYGFLRTDIIYDDSRMQHPQYAMWVLSEDPLVGPANDARLTFHPRLTRLGAKLKPYDLGGGASVRGAVEIDFQNGGSESREAVRMRQAYFEIAAGDFRALAGQTWDLVSPLHPAANNDAMMWNSGNLGDRRPQVRASFLPAVGEGRVTIAAAAGLPNAVDGKDLDGNGVPDGQDAAEPLLQGLVEYAGDLGTGGEVRIGAWGLYGTERTAAPVAGESEFHSRAVGVGVSVPLGSRLALEGEAWGGEDLSDLRGGIGQGVNKATGKEIASRGGWAQLVVKAHGKVTLFGGVAVDDPDEDDLISLGDVNASNGALSIGDVGRTKNRAIFFVGRYRPWEPIRVAVEYLSWTTEYAGLGDGTDHRIDTHFTLFF